MVFPSLPVYDMYKERSGPRRETGGYRLTIDQVLCESLDCKESIPFSSQRRSSCRCGRLTTLKSWTRNYRAPSRYVGFRRKYRTGCSSASVATLFIYRNITRGSDDPRPNPGM